MKKKFRNNIIGYSDHTVGLYAPYAALTLGAKIIEKHYKNNIWNLFMTTTKQYITINSRIKHNSKQSTKTNINKHKTC